MTELKPCPFCTCTHCFAYVSLTDTAKKFNAQVLCPNCGARSRPFFSKSDAYATKQAIEAWNRRAE